MRRLHSLALALLMTAGLGSGCAEHHTASSERQASVPYVSGLKARVEALYRAEQSKDWRTWYVMISPQNREEGTYADFLRAASKFDAQVLSFRILSIEPFEPDDRCPDCYAASVRMDVRTEMRGGPIEKAIDQTDYWVYIDGDWYWTWRGWPTD